MSLMRFFVRSFMRSHAPVPRVERRGGVPPSALRYFDILWREWMDRSMMSPLWYTILIISWYESPDGTLTRPANFPMPKSTWTMKSPGSISSSSFMERATFPALALSERRLYLWKRSKIWWSVKKQTFMTLSANPSWRVLSTGMKGTWTLSGLSIARPYRSS